jgi:broad specificity phosphatase PhoE
MGSLFLVRHAQARFGSSDYDRLSPLGMQQARLAGQYFAAFPTVVARIVAGTLKRQIDTASAIAERLSAITGRAVQVDMDPRLDELALDEHIERILPMLPDPTGAIATDWAEAKTSSRSYQKVIRRVFPFWQTMSAVAESESWSAFGARIQAALKDLTTDSGRGETTVAVSSGAVIATATQQVLGLPQEATYGLFEVMKNCSVTHFLHSSNRISLSSFNDTSFLAILAAHSEPNIITYR